eukprot:13666917-Alexandrium_andersonii.AAC.1
MEVSPEGGPGTGVSCGRAPDGTGQGDPVAPQGEEFDFSVDPALEAALQRLRVGRVAAPGSG